VVLTPPETSSRLWAPSMKNVGSAKRANLAAAVWIESAVGVRPGLQRGPDGDVGSSRPDP
jgi:hypothetical protein